MPLTQTPPQSRLSTAAFVASVLASVVALFLPDAPDAGIEVPGLDKVVHLVLFAMLAASAAWRFGRTRRVIGLLIAYAAASEVAQGVLFANRAADPLDVAADMTGVVVGLLVFDAFSGARPGSVSPTSAHDEVPR